MLVVQIVLNTAYGSLSPRLSLNLTVPVAAFVPNSNPRGHYRGEGVCMVERRQSDPQTPIRVAGGRYGRVPTADLADRPSLTFSKQGRSRRYYGSWDGPPCRSLVHRSS